MVQANHPNVLAVHEADLQEQDIFSPGRSPHSSMSSPQVSVDSPRICFSPLRIKVIDLESSTYDCPYSRRPQNKPKQRSETAIQV